MSSIVSLNRPDLGSVSASKERRWMSIRCGTSRGFGRREKLLLVTGAAFTRANSATPQLVEGLGCARRNPAAKSSTARGRKKYHIGDACLKASGHSGRKKRRFAAQIALYAVYLTSTSPPAS